MPKITLENAIPYHEKSLLFRKNNELAIVAAKTIAPGNFHSRSFCFPINFQIAQYAWAY